MVNERINLADVLDGPAVAVIAELQSLVDKHGPDSYIRFEDDYDSATVEFIWMRPETDEEFNKRRAATLKDNKRRQDAAKAKAKASITAQVKKIKLEFPEKSSRQQILEELNKELEE
jgi:hypothetical protein